MLRFWFLMRRGADVANLVYTAAKRVLETRKVGLACLLDISGSKVRGSERRDLYAKSKAV